MNYLDKVDNPMTRPEPPEPKYLECDKCGVSFDANDAMVCKHCKTVLCMTCCTETEAETGYCLKCLPAGMDAERKKAAIKALRIAMNKCLEQKRLSELPDRKWMRALNYTEGCRDCHTLIERLLKEVEDNGLFCY